VSILKEISEEEFMEVMNNISAGQIIDLTSRDFRRIEMRDEKIKSKFNYITKEAANSPPDRSIYIDMTNSNISRRDFSNFDLSHVIMTGIVAECTIFTGSNLSDTKIDEADLKYADFRHTKLDFTKFHNSDITGVNFTGADLTHSYGLKFSDADEKTIRRLGQASSIKGAKLPSDIEAMRVEIEDEIRINSKRKRVTAKAVITRPIPETISNKDITKQAFSEIFTSFKNNYSKTFNFLNEKVDTFFKKRKSQKEEKQKEEENS